MKKIVKYSLFTLGGLFLTGLIFSSIMLFIAYRSLPDIEELVRSYEPAVPTTIYDEKGEVVDLISRELRVEVKIDDVPDDVKNAFVAIEDRRFYSHHGIDPIRLGKAFLVNISQGRAAQGGSTITQQLAKNAFLTNEKKLMRKVKELLISLEIEKKFEKDEILEKYMNEIYFGSGFYGVQTASLSIFSKPVDELTLPEAALLAGIPNRPGTFDPRRNLERSVERSHLVLYQMRRQDLITQEEYDKAKNHKFLRESDLPNDYRASGDTSLIYDKTFKVAFKSPAFMDIIKEELYKLFGENAVYEDGLKVFTSLDLGMQKAAVEAFEEYAPFKRNPKLQGALVTIDSENGHVKSLIGGRDFKSGDFNRALRAMRQPGSAFKPFVYYTALEKGMPMNKVFEDAPVKYGSWEPQNYGRNFIGDVSIMEAMEKSINIIAIKVLDEVGVSNVQKTMDRTGVDMDVPKDLSAALGTVTTTPMDLAVAYLPFSNGGSIMKPVYILKVLNREDATVYEHTPRSEKRFDTTPVSLIVHMMRDVVANGSGRNAKVVDRRGNPIQQGGKTGTTNGFRSAWYAGITPQYVTTLYIGYDDNSSMPAGSTGGSLAAPLWRLYYQKMINTNAYIPSNFQFIQDEIEKGELVLVNFDSRTGYAGENTSGFSRTGLFRKGKEPDVYTKRTFLNLGRFFGGSSEREYEGSIDGDINYTPIQIDTSPASDEEIEATPQEEADLEDEGATEATPPKEEKDSKEKTLTEVSNDTSQPETEKEDDPSEEVPQTEESN